MPYPLHVDWKSDLPTFIEVMRRVIPSPDAFVNDGIKQPRFQDAEPVYPYDLKLIHFEQPISPDAIMRDCDVASFRDICTFVAKVDLPQNVEMLALGSYRSYIGSGPARMFVKADTFTDKIHLGWTPGLYQFDPNYFFLTRVPK